MHFVAVGVAPFENATSGPVLGELNQWLAEVAAQKPAAVVVGELVPPWSGRELALRLSRSLPNIPVVGVIARGDVAAAVRWFQAGAAEVVEPPIAMTVAPPVGYGENPIARFLAWAKRRAIHGQLVVYPNTPFEGRLKFMFGELAEAKLLSLPSAAVLAYLLDVGDAEIRWEKALNSQQFRPRILVVEDDESLRSLVVQRLERQGYAVSTVVDGIDALAAVAQADFDLMLLDLHMPRLDGWSALRTLQSDLRNRELPVVLWSAHEGDVDALKAARAGARAYLKKSGHVKDLLTAVELLTRPRRLVIDALDAGREVEVVAASVGMFWFLATLGARQATGVLVLEDELGRYELQLEVGRVVQLVAQQGSLRAQGMMALDSIVTSRGRGTFSPTPTSTSTELTEAPELEPLLAEAVSRRSEFTRAALKELALRPERLVVHEELGALFGKSASLDELNVLNGLRERRSLEALTHAARSEMAEVEDILQHLLWRGIVTAEDSPLEVSASPRATP